MEQKTNSPFKLLMNKEVYAILDGDTKFEEYEFSDDCRKSNISMPYLNGPALCNLCSMFGLPMTYSWGSKNYSRWEYLKMLFEHCIKENRCSDLLAHLFDKQRFSTSFKGHEAEVIDNAYNIYIQTIMGKINGILYFGGNKLVSDGKQFSIRKIGAKVEVKTPVTKVIDREYIRNLSKRAMDDIDKKNYDSAITKSRTMLEEVFCYVIEKKHEIPAQKGKIGKLYKQVRELYNMHSNADSDRRINELLSGLEKIVSAIAEMRNKDSDAHGVGASRIAIYEHHALLCVNAAMTMAEFILSVEKKAHIE